MSTTDETSKLSTDLSSSSSNNLYMNLLTMDNPVFCCWLFWCSVLIIKLLLMAILTAVQRIIKKAFANPEDATLNKTTEITENDPDVERVRRAHLNDLENILPFLIISLAYITTDPNRIAACTLFRIAAVARILHTLVYAIRPVPQPTRMITFFITFSIALFMAFYTAVQSGRFI